MSEHPLPAAYDDCWEVLASTASGSFPDEWLSGYGGLGRLYLGGDSAGANTAHHMAVKAASNGINIKGLLLYMSPMVWRFGISRSRQEGEQIEILAVCVPRDNRFGRSNYESDGCERTYGGRVQVLESVS